MASSPASPTPTCAPVFYPCSWCFLQGWKRPLAHEDLPTLPDHCFTKACGPRFYKSWHGTLDKLEQTPEVSFDILRKLVVLHNRVRLLPGQRTPTSTPLLCRGGPSSRQLEIPRWQGSS